MYIDSRQLIAINCVGVAIAYLIKYLIIWLCVVHQHDRLL